MRVYAVNAVGYSAPTPARSTATGAASQAPMRSPGRPTSVALAVKSGSELRVTWSPPTDSGGDAVSSYIVSYGTSLAGGELGGGGNLSVTWLPDAGPYSKVVGGLAMGTRYFVMVAACNSQGCGTAQQSTPTREHPRQLPKSPAALRLGVTSGSMLTAAFDPPLSDGGDAVTSARVEWDVDPEFEGTSGLPLKGSAIVAWPAAAAAAGTQYFTVANLQAALVYVRVSAGNRVGFSAPSYAVPAGLTPRRQVAGRPYDIVAAPATQLGACRSVSVTFAAPLIPAHGLWCASSANGLSPAACPLGMGFGAQADGGAAIASYEITWSSFRDFSDVVTQGGTVSVPVAAGDQGLPVSVILGPGSGANLQPGSLYYIRVAARNAVGVSPFCAATGPLCNGAPLASAPSAACDGATASASPTASVTPSPTPSVTPTRTH